MDAAADSSVDNDEAEIQPLVDGRHDPSKPEATRAARKVESTTTLRETILLLVPLVYIPGFVQGLYDYVADPVMPLYASSLGCSPAQV